MEAPGAIRELSHKKVVVSAYYNIEEQEMTYEELQEFERAYAERKEAEQWKITK